MGCRRGLRQAAGRPVETEAKQPGLQPPDNRGEQQKKQQQAAEEGPGAGHQGLGPAEEGLRVDPQWNTSEV